MTRQVVIDIEYTQTDIKTERIYEIGMIECEDFKPTGKRFSALINPEKPLVNSPEFTHVITDAELADKPIFAEVAQDIIDFIGDSQIYITCITHMPNKKEGRFTAEWDKINPPKGSETADIDFLNMEMERAGFPPFPDEQWVNARRMFELVLGGQKQASFKNVLNHCGGLKKEDFGTAHRADDDAMMLVAVLPQMTKEFEEQLAEQNQQRTTNKITPPKGMR